MEAVIAPALVVISMEFHSPTGLRAVLSPVENGGASRWKMAARGIEGLSGLAPGEPGNGIG
jgi:hypothetical protein